LTADDFSLVNGGLFYRILTGIGLIKPGSNRVVRRIIVFALITWLPPLILAAVQGLAWNKSLKIPFLQDFVAHTRYLLTLPLLLLAEEIVDVRVSAQVKHCIDSRIVPESEIPKFEKAISEVARLKNSAIVELLIVALSYSSILFRAMDLESHKGTWRVFAEPSGLQITLAGWWYVVISIPIFQFVMVRWLWRLTIWTWFLRRVSKLKLQLIPTHADLAAGLGFFGTSTATFGMIPFALACVVSAMIGKEIIFDGATLNQFRPQIAGFVLLSLAINFGPLLVFVLKLAITKRKALLAYGALVDVHDRSFWEKWVQTDHPDGESMRGNPDASSLADLGTGYERIRSMRLVPFDLRSVVTLTVTEILPLLPLLLTIYPFDELMKKVFDIFL